MIRSTSIRQALKATMHFVAFWGLVCTAAPLFSQPTLPENKSANASPATKDDPTAIALAEAAKAEAEGTSLYKESKFNEALASFQKSLDTREKLLKDHRLTANSLLCIGQTLQAAGKNVEAEKPLQRCITMMEKVAGPDDLYIATSMVNLGIIYNVTGRLRDAEAMYLKALKIREKALGEEHVLTAEVCNNLGVVYDKLEDLQTAENFYRRAVDVREKKLGSKNLDTAQSMANLGITRRLLKNAKGAIPLLQTALTTYQQLAGPGHPRIGTCYDNLALAQNDLGNPQKALEFARQGFETRDKYLGRDNLDTLASLRNFAVLLSQNGLKQEAAERNQQAYEAYCRIAGPESENALLCLLELSFASSTEGRYDEAEERLNRLVEIRMRLNGPDHSRTAIAIYHMGNLKFLRGMLEEAQTDIERAIKTIERNEGSESTNLTDPLTSLGIIRLRSGRLDEAAVALERAARLVEKRDGPNSVDLARKLYSVAGLRLQQSRFAEAEELYRRAGHIFLAAFGPAHSSVGSVYSDVSLMYISLGDYRSGEEAGRKALANLEKSLGTEHPVTVTALNNLAINLSHQSRITEAEPLLQRVLELRRKFYGEMHQEVAAAERNLSFVDLKLGRTEAAHEHSTKALAIFESKLGKDHPEVAETLTHVGATEKILTMFADAEVHLRRASVISRKTLGPDHPRTNGILYELADCLVAQKKYDEGFDISDEQQQAARRYVLSVLPGLSSSEQIRFLHREFVWKLHGSLNVAVDNADRVDLVQKAAAWWINGKSVAQESLAFHNRLMRDVTDTGRARDVQQLMNVRAELAACTMLKAEEKYGPNQMRRLQELVAMEQSGLKKIVGAQVGAEPTNAWISLSQIKRSLPANVALIDIVRLDRHYPRVADPAKRWGPAQYQAFVTHRNENKPTRMISLGDAKEIDALVKQVRTTVNEGAGPQGSIAKLGEEAASLEVRQIFAKLAEKIWQPIVAEIGDANQLIISPDGALWLLPWNALPIASEKEEYLIEKYALRYVVCPRDLVNQNSLRSSSPPLIVADPQFEGPEDTKAIEENLRRFANSDQVLKNIAGYDPTKIPLVRGYHSEGFLPKVQPLPNTAVEALAIQPNIEKLARLKPVVYQQAAATEKNIKKAVGPRVLSIATHGFFLAEEPTTPKDSAGLQAADAANSVDTQHTTTGKMKPMSDNPLLHCGLLLNGCNNPRLPQYQDDGILTGLEIIGMDLRGTELVVLSACETGLGTINNGDGVAGLRQAFQLAGAQSVVATLWQVPDRDSALLMNSFFDNLADGQSKANALRIAQVERIQKRRERYGAAHPYFWSAYTLTGR